jgi:hypothetical protein
VATKSLDTTSAEADAENLENIGKIRTAGRVEDEARFKVPEKEGQRKVKDERNEESQPPADVLLAVSGGNTCEAQSACFYVETDILETYP